jgi:hypothetical protein
MVIDKEMYLEVLKMERDKILKDYYRPQEGGTGHFNTAASVLKMRIEQIEKELL